MPPKLFEKRGPSGAKSKSGKAKVLWEYIPREKARMAFAYCLWRRISALEARPDIKKLTPEDVQPDRIDT